MGEGARYQTPQPLPAPSPARLTRLAAASGLFDSSFYLQSNPDVAAAGVNPLVHYLASGGLEGRDPHPLFDSSFYLQSNPDVAAAA